MDGSYGNALDPSHDLSIRKVDGPHLRLCDCGYGQPRATRPKVTHFGAANGVVLMAGCELCAYRWRAKMLKARALR